MSIGELLMWYYVLTIIRGLSTGIYTTNSPEACHYILENSKANIVVVEDQKQLDKILEVRSMNIKNS